MMIKVVTFVKGLSKYLAHIRNIIRQKVKNKKK